MLQSEEVRKLFFNFFEQRGHKVIQSSSLVPEDDPSVLLTTAGMQPFKKYFTGEIDSLADFGTARVCSIQKCFRTTDIEEVGDERHLTFFEMLGNFSFGQSAAAYRLNADSRRQLDSGSSYFKQEAIEWAKEFLEEVLQLQIDYVSVFKGEGAVPFDAESDKVWQSLKLPAEQVKQFGREDNFWGPTGIEGPCGPTTEIYIDGIEVWNLVFNEYYQRPNGQLEKLKAPGVDTGAGLERLMKVVQKKPTIFETDLFEKTRDEILQTAPAVSQRDLRVMADHLRAVVFLIADGIYPSNLERGYILRRILRRLGLKFKQNQVKLNQLHKFITAVIEKYSNLYPQLTAQAKIETVAEAELQKFEAVLERGIRKFEKTVKADEEGTSLAEKLFTLYTTHGLPLEISLELAKDYQVKVDESTLKKYQELFQEHQKISKS